MTNLKKYQIDQLSTLLDKIENLELPNETKRICGSSRLIVEC
jgi:hypothetical protein